MRCKKLAIIGLLVLSMFIVSCSSNAQGPSLKDAWNGIIGVAKLNFLDSYDALFAFMRIIIGIMAFSLLYMASRMVPGLSQNRNISIVACLILTIMTVKLI